MSFVEGPWLFVINPQSGNGHAGRLKPIIQNWSEANKKSAEIILTTGVGNARQIVADRHQSFSLVVAVGGDGTVSEVGSALIHTKTTLGILPCGSGNGLARHLSYPANALLTLNRLNQASEILMDTLQVNGKACLNLSGIGFDGYIAAEFGRGGKRGLSGYIRTTLNGLSRLKAFNFEAEALGIKRTSKASILVISNGSQYGNNAYLDPTSDVSDGKFEMLSLSTDGIIDATGLMVRSFRKKLLESTLVTRMPYQKEVIITLTASQPYHIDGEPMGMEKKFNIEILPQSLRVLDFFNQSPTR